MVKESSRAASEHKDSRFKYQVAQAKSFPAFLSGVDLEHLTLKRFYDVNSLIRELGLSIAKMYRIFSNYDCLQQRLMKFISVLRVLSSG